MKVQKKSKVKAERREEIRKLIDPKESKRAERKAENALIDLEEMIDERYKYAQTILELQDVETSDAVEMMVESMRKMAGSPQPQNGAEMARLERIQERSFYWIAVRILIACARWDIRIANFKLPLSKCAVCLKGVK